MFVSVRSAPACDVWSEEYVEQSLVLLDNPGGGLRLDGIHVRSASDTCGTLAGTGEDGHGYPVTALTRARRCPAPCKVHKTITIVKNQVVRKLMAITSRKISSASNSLGHLDLLRQDAQKQIKRNEPIMPYSYINLSQPGLAAHQRLTTKVFVVPGPFPTRSACRDAVSK